MRELGSETGASREVRIRKAAQAPPRGHTRACQPTTRRPFRGNVSLSIPPLWRDNHEDVLTAMTGHGNSRRAATSEDVSGSAYDGAEAKRARLDLGEVASPIDGRPASPCSPEDTSQLGLSQYRRSVKASEAGDSKTALRYAKECLRLCPENALVSQVAF